MRAGEVITAEVLRIDQNHVVVNAGLKSESFIPVEEFHNDQGELDVKEGDFVSVAIESLEDGRGETRLSRDRAKRLAAWAAIFAVCTAFAGIWGMNFQHMPELQWTYGYAAALALIAGTCVLLYRRFRRAGWL